MMARACLHGQLRGSCEICTPPPPTPVPDPALLALFKRCSHQYEAVDPESWAANPRYITMTCGRLVGEALANGCGQTGCPTFDLGKKP